MGGNKRGQANGPMSMFFIIGAVVLAAVALILFVFLKGDFGRRMADKFVNLFFAVSLPFVPFLSNGAGRKKRRKAQIDDEAVLTVTIIIGALFALVALIYLGFVNEGFAKVGALFKQKFQRTGGFFGT